MRFDHSAHALFQQQMSRYFSGELRHSKDFLTSLLETLMSDRPVSDIPCGVDGSHNTIPRVSRPWPARTKNALQMSLDCGIFEDIRIMASSGYGPTKYPVYLAGAVDERVGSSISQRKFLTHHEAN
jgi:hypothetical protein